MGTVARGSRKEDPKVDGGLVDQVIAAASAVLASGAISHNGHGNVSIRVPGEDEM